MSAVKSGGSTAKADVVQKLSRSQKRRLKALVADNFAKPTKPADDARESMQPAIKKTRIQDRLFQTPKQLPTTTSHKPVCKQYHISLKMLECVTTG